MLLHAARLTNDGATAWSLRDRLDTNPPPASHAGSSSMDAMDYAHALIPPFKSKEDLTKALKVSEEAAGGAKNELNASERGHLARVPFSFRLCSRRR